MLPGDANTGQLLTAAISFEQVTVTRERPDGTSLVVLAEASFAIPLGRSGTGKTTVLRLMNRLDDRDTGIIRIDGTDIHAFHPPHLRQRVGMLFQQPLLFDGSVLSSPPQSGHRFYPAINARLIAVPNDRVRATPHPTRNDVCVVLGWLHPHQPLKHHYLAANDQHAEGIDRKHILQTRRQSISVE